MEDVETFSKHVRQCEYTCLQDYLPPQHAEWMCREAIRSLDPRDREGYMRDLAYILCCAVSYPKIIEEYLPLTAGGRFTIEIMQLLVVYNGSGLTRRAAIRGIRMLAERADYYECELLAPCGDEQNGIWGALIGHALIVSLRRKQYSCAIHAIRRIPCLKNKGLRQLLWDEGCEDLWDVILMIKRFFLADPGDPIECGVCPCEILEDLHRCLADGPQYACHRAARIIALECPHQMQDEFEKVALHSEQLARNKWG